MQTVLEDGFMENLQIWAIGDDIGVEYLGRDLGKSISHIIKLTEELTNFNKQLFIDPFLLVRRLIEMQNNGATFWAFMDTLREHLIH